MMNSGTAWKTLPGSSDATAAASLLKHPTTAWPPTQGARSSFESVVIDAPSTTPTVRRAARPARQTPTVPWFLLITSGLLLTMLIMLVVKQRAELVKGQYALVDLKMQRAKVLKERAVLRLTLQRLTALERVDGLVSKHLKMVRPGRRVVLDLSRSPASAAAIPPSSDPTHALSSTAHP